MTCARPALWWAVLWRLALLCFRETLKFYTSHLRGSGHGEGGEGMAWTIGLDSLGANPVRPSVESAAGQSPGWSARNHHDPARSTHTFNYGEAPWTSPWDQREVWSGLCLGRLSQTPSHPELRLRQSHPKWKDYFENKLLFLVTSLGLLRRVSMKTSPQCFPAAPGLLHTSLSLAIPGGEEGGRRRWLGPSVPIGAAGVS